MTGMSLSLAAFRDLLDRQGAATARWPTDVRPAAEALIAADPVAARLFDETRRMERLVAAVAEPLPLEAAFVGRVMGRIEGHVGARETAFRFTRRLAFASATALTLCLVAGVAVGLVAPVLPPEDGTDIAVFVLGGSDDGETLFGDTLGGELL
jgi:anti-sigma factor RsiW